MARLARLRGEDVDEVAALSLRCFPHGSWTSADLIAELGRPFAEVWVARASERGPIAGYAVAWFVGDDAELHTIGTDPGVRRQGIARALVERVQASTREREVRSLTLEVRESNRAARALYEACGFETTDVRCGYYADGEDAFVMTWRP